MRVEPILPDIRNLSTLLDQSDKYIPMLTQEQKNTLRQSLSELLEKTKQIQSAIKM